MCKNYFIAFAEELILVNTRILFSLIGKRLTAKKLTDNSQEEEPEAVGKLSPDLLSPDKTNLTFFRKCLSIRASDYIQMS